MTQSPTTMPDTVHIGIIELPKPGYEPLRILAVDPVANADSKLFVNADKLAKVRVLLRDIENWRMPETGKFWPNEDGTISDRPMSYSACYGSNGERDYIRQKAYEIDAILEGMGV